MIWDGAALDRFVRRVSQLIVSEQHRIRTLMRKLLSHPANCGIRVAPEGATLIKSGFSKANSPLAIVALSLLCAVAAACSQKNPCREQSCIYLEGVLSEHHLEAIHTKLPTVTDVYINSAGGKTRIASAIGRAVYDSGARLHVYKECSSACAEYVLPASEQVYAVDNPIIGLHGNNFMIEAVYRESGYIRPAQCPSGTLNWLNEIYAVRSLNREFYKEQLERMDPVDIRFVIQADGCPGITKYDVGEKIWYPTSDELEQLWGLKIAGKLCSDDEACASKLK